MAKSTYQTKKIPVDPELQTKQFVAANEGGLNGKVLTQVELCQTAYSF